MNLAHANNTLAWELLSALRAPGGNVLFSPYSLHSALSMTANGAAGETLRAFKETLAWGRAGRGRLNAAHADLRRAMAEDAPDATLAIASALWVNPAVQLRPAFQAACQEYYAALTQAVEFSDPAALAWMNNWIAGQTGGRITDLIRPEDVSPTPLLILVNAIYFNAAWSKPFDPALTTEDEFHLASGESLRLPMMRRSLACQYADLPGLQMLSLPYAEAQFRLDICLPSETSSLEALLTGLDLNRWKSWVRRLNFAEVDVSLPRFRLEGEAALNQPLSDMGMALAFSDQADFSPMCAQPVKISQVRHKAFLEIDEQGSRATAATTVLMARTMALHRLRVRVDRPFLCAIRHPSSGALLFVGVVSTPTAF